MKKSILVISLVIVTILSLNSCSDNDFQKSIRGTWQVHAFKIPGTDVYFPIDQFPIKGVQPITFTFTKNKKCKMDGLAPIEGTYKVKDKTIEIFVGTLPLLDLPVTKLTPTDMEVHYQYHDWNFDFQLQKK